MFLMLSTTSFAQNISFVYINGSNNNDKEMTDWFYKGVKGLHPHLVRKFEKDKKSMIAGKKGFTFNHEPVIYFWGNKSRNDLNFVEQQLDISNAASSIGATIARTLIAKYFHDAIWIQKPHNMAPVLDELNELVKSEWEKGNATVLFGYSAGSFVNYEYLFNKVPYVDMLEVFEKLNVDKDVLNYAKKNPKQKTCISALSYGNIGVVSSNGHLILNNNDNKMLKYYDNMDATTDKYCSPKGALLGTVSFANPDYEINFYNMYLAKYIIENGLFMLTVNFREDPLGFPVTQNLTIDEIERVLEVKLENPKGIVYNDSAVWSGRPFYLAHTAYWGAKSIFPRAVVKKMIEGHDFQYDSKKQAKLLKKYRKKISF